MLTSSGGFVLGYAEDVVGCKISFPENHTTKYVSNLRVTEDVVYHDRHGVSLDEFDLESLHYGKISGVAQSEDHDSLESTMEMTNDDTSVASMVTETMADVTVNLERDKACATTGRTDKLSGATDVGSITRALPSEPTTPQRNQLVVNQSERCSEEAEQGEAQQENQVLVGAEQERPRLRIMLMQRLKVVSHSNNHLLHRPIRTLCQWIVRTS
ncbi:hypothetical protein PC116_g12845 [Phytophthora cactorum]|uniref:Uncharacterized protein n=2 Tax=Phytophthora cactorum TaxID=29920 RepID=A0A8T0Z636_9STRA|nr:hypothetical protein Pcac1_g6200 [Phytophthora cactorum]KAG2857500.1 hypothetical protein PC113_g10634 [Phytophthora cactorum]KAG2905765.1 hypothetical protein PC115_g14505 [Phytophthora cactorum]KAG3019624.1 hypothetical protein PC119_g10232 [Phytophthora cactorum]KAG3063953.1 hypothetical protein PC121_g11943 [Phytophthora cactorum]